MTRSTRLRVYFRVSFANQNILFRFWRDELCGNHWLLFITPPIFWFRPPVESPDVWHSNVVLALKRIDDESGKEHCADISLVRRLRDGRDLQRRELCMLCPNSRRLQTSGNYLNFFAEEKLFPFSIQCLPVSKLGIFLGDSLIVDAELMQNLQMSSRFICENWTLLFDIVCVEPMTAQHHITYSHSSRITNRNTNKQKRCFLSFTEIYFGFFSLQHIWIRTNFMSDENVVWIASARCLSKS